MLLNTIPVAEWVGVRRCTAAAEVCQHQQTNDGHLGDVQPLFHLHRRRRFHLSRIPGRLRTVRIPGVWWRQPRLSYHARLHVSSTSLRFRTTNHP